MPMHHKREQAIAWTVGLWELAKQHGDKVALENPVSVIFQHLSAPVCYVQPYEHGHGETKKTGFALHNLEPLKPTNLVDGREQRIWKMPPSPTRKRDRSQTFDGIAQAVVMQWANNEFYYHGHDTDKDSLTGKKALNLEAEIPPGSTPLEYAVYCLLTAVDDLANMIDERKGGEK
jgi:hypothetical protein